MMTRVETIAHDMLEALENHPLTEGDEQVVIMIRGKDGGGTEIHGFHHFQESELAAAAFVLIHAKAILERNGKQVHMGNLAVPHRG